MLQKFDKVTRACFNRDLDPNWKNILSLFKTSVWELISFFKFKLKKKISNPWKVLSFIKYTIIFCAGSYVGLSLGTLLR